MAVSVFGDDVARQLRDQVKWLREKAAETDIDRFRWMMDGLADDLERIAENVERGTKK
jgi:hypothetical protein